MSEMNPRIYVSCLAAYNQGILHGVWIDADQDEDDIQADIDKMLADSPVPDAEEWAIHDTEDMGDLVSEYESLENVSKHGQAIAEHGEAWIAYCDHVGADYADVDKFEDLYCGECESELEYAEQMFDELYLGDIPENLRPYIDYEKFSKDLFINDFYFSSGHVFRRY